MSFRAVAESSRVRRRPASFAFATAAAFVAAGCQRGCLSTWLAEHDPAGPRSGTPGSGGAGPRGSDGPDAPATLLDLGGTDCSDGLARCSAGRVEISVAGHVPHPCVARPELPDGCSCPWRSAGACSAECVKDGLEVVAAPDVAREQLCASAERVLRPVSAAEVAAVTICAEAGISCVERVVEVCVARGQPARLTGACIHGCAAGVSLDPSDALDGDGATAILCRRAHAERR